jgi:hypothetical protein
MGGVGAWRERENERNNFAQQWDEQPQTNDDEDDDEDEEESEEEEEDEEGGEKGDRPIKLNKKERRQLEKEARAAREEVWGYDDDSAQVKRAKEEEAAMRDDDVSVLILYQITIRANRRKGVYYGHDAQDHEYRP